MPSEDIALCGGKPLTCKQSLARLLRAPEIGNEEIAAAKRVLLSRKLNRVSSDEVEKFEKEFSRYIGTKHALVVNSGTAALHASLAALGLGPGDEVIVPAYTYMAAAHAVLHQNAIPIFADIKPDNFNIDPLLIEGAVSERTKAIIVPHLFGCPAEMNAIMRIARRHHFYVVEDCCQACGAEYEGRKVGSIGDIGCFSFGENKNMTTGEGGAITTDLSEVDKEARIVAHEGEVFGNLASTTSKQQKLPISSAMFYNHIGYNYRMSAIHAAIGRVQLQKLEDMNARKISNARYINERLLESGLFTPQTCTRNAKHLYTYYVGILRHKKVSRDMFIECLNAEGIGAGTFYPTPLPYNPIFKERKGYGKTTCPFSCPLHDDIVTVYDEKFPVAEEVCNSQVALPVHGYQCQSDLDIIVRAFEKVATFFDRFGQVAEAKTKN